MEQRGIDMLRRKDMKKRGKAVLKSHYWILIAVCLFASFIGTEFAGTLSWVKSYSNISSAGKGDVQATGDLASEGDAASGEQLSTGATSGSYQQGFSDTLTSLILGNFEESAEISQNITDNAVQNSRSEGANAALGRSRGVLSQVINLFTSGSFLVIIASAMAHVITSRSVVIALMIVMGFLVMLAVRIFLIYVFKAISRRIFLEARVYENVPMRRLLFFRRVGCYTKASVTMFMCALFQGLWSITIIGGIIKKYSYYMVPYIVAENPDLGWRKTIKLSRMMMNGHKWQCFIFEWSFFWWNVLGTITLGFTDMLYTNPYKVATFSEYYAELRRLYIDDKKQGWEAFNDRYLFEKADGQLLAETYKDMAVLEKVPEVQLPLTGVRAFLAKWLGITIFNRHDEDEYRASEERKVKLRSMRSAIQGQSYPGRLFVVPERERGRKLETIHYLRHYSITSLILIFFSMSFIGWCWEVSLHLVSDGKFVNRGVLHGPVLPIYGMGGILILIFLNVFRKKPLAEFVSAIVLCGCVEYFTGLSLELSHDGQKWWDYSGYFLNLHGRICAEGLLVFGLGGMAIVYFVAPLLDNWLRKLSLKVLVPVCVVLLAIYCVDQAYSSKHPNMGEGITDYGQEEVSQADEGWADVVCVNEGWMSGGKTPAEWRLA